MKNSKEIASTILDTPIGPLRVEATVRGLYRVVFGATCSAESNGAPREAQAHLEKAVRQLREYFAGRRDAFDLPLDLEGTPHQQRVWRALAGIPFGRTISYGQLAAKLGSRHAARDRRLFYAFTTRSTQPHCEDQP